MYCHHHSTYIGETLLHCVCIRGDFSAVVSLIDNGADVHARDNACKSPEKSTAQLAIGIVFCTNCQHFSNCSK